jgi:RimJ/RimL family protein N-acetyltransferase
VSDLYGMAMVGNKASRAVLEKCGLRYVETFEDEGDPLDWLHLSKTGFMAIQALLKP